MNLKNLALISAAFLISSPVFASTYFVGYEDSIGYDYDYNDAVFSLTGSGLKLNSAADFYTMPALNNSGAPFWNNLSADVPASTNNVGYCIYGGGACNGGFALSSSAQFLASNPTTSTGSANDVTFSASGAVTVNVADKVSAATSLLGYYLVSDSTHTPIGLTTIGAGTTYTFTPTGNFGLVLENTRNSNLFYSQSALGVSDSVSHLAFFSAAPEPGMMGLVGAGLLSVVAFFRRRKGDKV